jgi:protein ImuB
MLYAPVRGKLVIQVCSPWASRHGIEAGMALGQARAILGDHAVVCFKRHDISADAKALRSGAEWCQRFSPLVAVQEPDSLLLDITGCGPVFGGEHKLAETALFQLRQRGYFTRVAVADTPAGAWAIAHFHAHGCQVVSPGKQREVLAALPVAALRLPPETCLTLRELDIRHIGQLLELPRSLLPSRFGRQMLRCLDQALGDVADPLIPEGFTEPAEESWTFDFPCADCRLLERVVEQLLQQLLAKLHVRQLGVQQFSCSMQHAGAEQQCLRIGLLKPSQSLKYLMELTRLHLDRAHLTREVTGVTVRALTAPVPCRQQRLFGEDAWSERDKRFPALVDVLSSRLGKEAVLRPLLQADAQPEYSWRYEPWLDQRLTGPVPSAGDGARRSDLFRPPRLIRPPAPVRAVSVFPNGPPVRFEWKRQSLAVARYWGPERIETGWWRDADVRRDYYLVETASAERFWLFRLIDQERWFVHGTFA